MADFSSNKPAGSQNLDEPIPLDSNLDDPVPVSKSKAGATVSHAPLTLGGASSAVTPKQPEHQKQQSIATQAIASAGPAAARGFAETSRITGVRTFIAKLHPGAIEFMDGQINNWLKENPHIQIKQTNSTTGEVEAKKIEPNIIVTVWY